MKIIAILLYLSSVLYGGITEFTIHNIDHTPDCSNCKTVRMKNGNIIDPAQYGLQKKALLPLYMNVPSSSIYSKNISLMMGEYNKYGNFFVETNDDTVPAWRNNISEYYGVLTNDEILVKFPWVISLVTSNSLAFTATHTNESTYIIEESDIVMLDRPFVNDSQVSSGYGYGKNQTLIHELGHCIGLDHDFMNYSIMNYSQQHYQYNYHIKEADMNSLRRLYYGLYDFNDVALHLSYFIGKYAYSSSAVYENNTTNTFIVKGVNVEYIGGNEKDLNIEC